MEYFKNASLLTPLINVKIDVFWQKLQGSQTFLKVCQVNEIGESILRLLQNDTALSRSEISQKIRLSERRTRPLFVKLIQKGKVLEIARSKKDHHKKIYTKKRRPLSKRIDKGSVFMYADIVNLSYNKKRNPYADNNSFRSNTQKSY